MTITIGFRKKFYIPLLEDPYKHIHICMGDTKSLDVSNQLSLLANSEFIKSLLRYKEEKKVTETFLFKMIVGSVIAGIVMYVILINVLKNVIFRIIGELTLKPPENP